MLPYVAEPFTSDEEAILRRYLTNLDQPVFALVNLPEVVKGALFARYSRSSKSLRRLFLEEFVGDLDVSGDATIDATVGLARAEQLYEQVFLEYGDDSVAQLGGVHLACEQSSNVLSKILEWGRLMSYLEQSTRYIALQPAARQRAVPLLPPSRAARLTPRRPLRRRDGPYVRHLRRAAAADAGLGGRAVPPAGGRQRLRLPPGDAGQVARCTAGHAARRVALEHRSLRDGPVLRAVAAAHARASAARGSPLRGHDAGRVAQGDPFLLATGRRPRARRRVVGLHGVHP